MTFGRNLIKTDYIRLTTTMDAQMDGRIDRQAENNRAPPTFVGEALMKFKHILQNNYGCLT